MNLTITDNEKEVIPYCASISILNTDEELLAVSSLPDAACPTVQL